MTRKDYVKVAAVLHAERQAIKEEAAVSDAARHAFAQASRTVERLEQSLVLLFSEDNPLFDPKRFRLASGGRISNA